MKGTDWHTPPYGAGGTKKRYTHKNRIDGFFVPGVTLSVTRVPFMMRLADAPLMGTPQDHSFYWTSANYSAAGALAGFMSLAMQSKPAAVFFSALGFVSGGLQDTGYGGSTPQSLASRFLSFSRFVKEYIVTLTDHIRKIQEHAERAIEHVDDRDYACANVALDNIEANIHSARDHIENLQLKADCAARPAGD